MSKFQITQELADKYDGRCFLDLDMPDRIEAVRFNKKDSGLEGEYIGCNFHWGYDRKFTDPYGEMEEEDSYHCATIVMLEDGMILHREITREEYYRIKGIVRERIDTCMRMQAEFSKIQESVLGKEGK